MRLSVDYGNEGIWVQLQDCESPMFPLDHMQKNEADTGDWEQLIAVEQLWYDGQLVFDKQTNRYLLPAISCTKLDNETREALQLPDQNAKIEVSERGFLGSRSYAIRWSVLFGQQKINAVRRRGAVIEYASRLALLTTEQYELIQKLEEPHYFKCVMDQAQFRAEIDVLADRAAVQRGSFMERREFAIAETAGFGLESSDPHEIRFVPQLGDLPSEEQEQLPTKLGNITRVKSGGRTKTVFTDEKTKETYNIISQLQPLRNQEVPEFLDNPLAFIPEELPFDEDEFSKRVKGLKIRRATAEPYVRVSPDNNRPGWFDVDSGYALHSDNIEEMERDVKLDEACIKMMQAAADAGERYFFYDDQWIKIDPKMVRQFQRAREQTKEEFGNSVAESQLKYILDIYDNLERIEYDETLLSHKEAAELFSSGYEVPPCFFGKLQAHQEEGYSFLRSHYEKNMGVLLADDMGLGKTVQVIAFLSYLYSVNHLATALLVMPKSLIENWQQEFVKFLPVEKKIYVHQGMNRYRQKEPIEQYDLVLTTYETLARDQTMLARIPWTCVICDEVQRIKNFKTLAASAVKGMNTKCRIAMTGTPVENRLGELWSIVDFAQPGLLDSYQAFRKKYELPLQETHGRDEMLTTELVHTLSPIFLRRTKDILSNQLPPKTEETVPIEIDQASYGLYCDVIQDLRDSDEQGMILATIQKLLMLCSHPRLITGGTINGCTADSLIGESPKLKWTVQALSEIFSRGEKVILFTKYKKMQSILRYVILQKFGIDAQIINGEITGNRVAVIEKFSAQHGAGAIILSPRAAGVGLTITAANHVIHYSREWNPAVENQATDRAYRIGQTKPVEVCYPVISSSDFVTADQRLDELLNSKRELMKNVIVPADLNIKLKEFESILAMNQKIS